MSMDAREVQEHVRRLHRETTIGLVVTLLGLAALYVWADFEDAVTVTLLLIALAIVRIEMLLREIATRVAFLVSRQRDDG